MWHCVRLCSLYFAYTHDLPSPCKSHRASWIIVLKVFCDFVMVKDSQCCSWNFLELFFVLQKLQFWEIQNRRRNLLTMLKRESIACTIFHKSCRGCVVPPPGSWIQQRIKLLHCSVCVHKKNIKFNTIITFGQENYEWKKNKSLFFFL